MFLKAKELAGLGLKPIKCILIPLVPFDEGLPGLVSNWLRDNIPQWVGFKVVGAAKYLGFFLGPLSGALQWNAPINKYLSRIHKIGASNAGAALASYSYNTNAVPVLSYVSQLCFLPKNFGHIERVAMQKVLHMATNALHHPDFLSSMCVVDLD